MYHWIMEYSSWNKDASLQRKRPHLFLKTATVDVTQKGNDYREVAVSIKSEAEITNKERNETFHSAISSVLIAAQCFGLLPVYGITNRVDKLRFRWLSFRTMYSFLIIVGALVTTLFCILHLGETGFSFVTSSCTVFSLTAAVSLLLFFKLAIDWPNMLHEWHKVEKKINVRYKPTCLKTRFRRFTFALLSLALVEHLLANLRHMEYALECMCCTPQSVFHAFVMQSNEYVMSRVGYAHWKGVLLCVMSIIKTFCWNFTDLFITLVSIALADRFDDINRRIQSTYGQPMPSVFWQVVREDYNLLTGLTREVDSCLNKIILLSFASNLYFICYQTLNSMRPLGIFSDAIYFYWSILYIILKTCVVSLSTASIHENSKKPIATLYAVPYQSYCLEAQRFLYQLTTDHVALTGMNFFSVTRSFVMSVAGTIVTYEVVLMQFNIVADLSANQIPLSDNTTLRCQWLLDTSA